MAHAIRSAIIFAIGVNLSISSVRKITGNSESVALCPTQEDAFGESLFLVSTRNEDNYYESSYLLVEDHATFEMAYLVLASDDSRNFNITLSIIDEDGNASSYHVSPAKLNEENIFKLLLSNKTRKRIRYKVK